MDGYAQCYHPYIQAERRIGVVMGDLMDNAEGGGVAEW